MTDKNRHNVKLAAFPKTGSDTHIVADTEVTEFEVMVMTACGKLFPAQQMVDIAHNQVSCSRCRSVSKRYSHKLGLIE